MVSSPITDKIVPNVALTLSVASECSIDKITTRIIVLIVQGHGA